MSKIFDYDPCIIFNCECGSKRYYRPVEIGIHCKTFFEGYFQCEKCNKEHNYCSDAFVLNSSENKQLTLF